MKSLFHLSFWTFSVALLVACSATKPLTSTMKVAKDDTFNYRVTQNTNMNISVMGQDMSTSGKQETDYAFIVKSVAPSGDFETTVTIDRVAFNQKVPMMGDVAYDSADPASSKSSPMKSLGETVGKSFNVSYDKNGIIQKTEGVDEIIGGIVKGLEGQGGEQIVAQLGTAGITNTLKNLSGILEGNPKVGSTWTKTNDVSGIVDMKMEQTFTVRERKNGQIIVDVTGTAQTIDTGGGLEFQGMEIGYDLAGPVTGTIVVDEKTGWAISSEVVPDLKGKMKIKGGPFGEMNVNAAMKLGITAVRK